jgi:glycosyltransferase involved in cell wall biosynthesis
MLVSWLGVALLAGAALPAARLFTHHPGDTRQLAYTLAAFAPGLIGYGLSTHLSRVLFADARTRVAAAALVTGWLLVIVADVVAVALVPDWWVVPVLGLGNTIGMTVSGLALLGAVRGARGRAALRGVSRAALAGLAGALAGAAAGAALCSAVPARGFIPNAGLALLACAFVTLVFGGAALALDGGDLRAVLARDTPGVLHAHGLRAGALAALALAVPGTPRTALAVTVHNAPPAGGPAAAVYAGLELIVARRADAVLTVSADLDARLRRRGARLAGRALVPAPAWAGASPAEVMAVRREVGGDDPGGCGIVLGVGRLAGQKGFGTLISAAARWQSRPAVPLLLIAGEGPLDAELRRQAGTDGAAVRFLGPRDDVPALLAAADVVVVPSTWEGQPLIVQEALRAGRPLVATRVGGITELTGEDGALLVPPGDPAALAAAVSRLLDDPQAAARLSAAARARAALLPGESAAVDQALGLYQRVRSAGNGCL